jgi:hypothetical protein
MAVSKSRIDIAEAPSVETGGDARSVRGDESHPAVTSGLARGTNRSPFWAYGAVAFVTAAFWLVNSFTAADDAARRGGAYRLGASMFFEGTSAIIILALLPLMRRGVALVRAGGSWPVGAARAGALGMVFAVVHIFGMVALRKLAYWGVGQIYVFNLATEIPYEFRKDVVSALLIGAAFWLLDRPAGTLPPTRAEGEVPPTIDGKPPNPMIWLRDGATSIRVDARDVVWVASAGNYVEFSLPAKRHLVRGTLAGEEARLLPFGLVRVHRTRLANLNHAIAIEPRPSGDFALHMDSGETLIGSRRYKNAVAALRGSEAS